MNPTIKCKCDECGELHDDYLEAGQCCAPSITEVLVCGHCSECFGEEDEDAAEQCCADAPLVSQQEMEVAGQMKLNINNATQQRN